MFKDCMDEARYKLPLRLNQFTFQSLAFNDDV